MQLPDQFVTLENLMNGGATELFGDELGKIIRDVADPNKKATAERTITLKFKLQPDEKRQKCAVALEASSKLAPAMPAESTLFVGTCDGVPVAYEDDPRQVRMKFDQPAESEQEPPPPSPTRRGGEAEGDPRIERRENDR